MHLGQTEVLLVAQFLSYLTLANRRRTTERLLLRERWFMTSRSDVKICHQTIFVRGKAHAGVMNNTSASQWTYPCIYASQCELAWSCHPFHNSPCGRFSWYCLWTVAITEMDVVLPPKEPGDPSPVAHTTLYEQQIG